MDALESKIEELKSGIQTRQQDIVNSALGNAASNATVYAAKKLFGGHTLPATKGDFNILKQDLEKIHFILRQMKV
ncbi:hypothetical protein [Formosa sp. S-31]|uniref:hypothetical protein n=1 Tax=Formosa sp. S-31 TaxID=2790949 RepID=UPI003EB9D14C